MTCHVIMALAQNRRGPWPDADPRAEAAGSRPDHLGQAAAGLPALDLCGRAAMAKVTRAARGAIRGGNA